MQNIPYAIKLGRRLGLSLNKNMLLPSTLKVRENANAIKEKLILHICKVFNKENNWQPDEHFAGNLFNKAINQSANDYME